MAKKVKKLIEEAAKKAQEEASKRGSSSSSSTNKTSTVSNQIKNTTSAIKKKTETTRQKNIQTAQRKYDNATDRRSRAAYKTELDLAKYPLSSSDRKMSTADRMAVTEYKKQWFANQGNTEKQKSLNYAANALRAKYGFSGGTSGMSNTPVAKENDEQRYLRLKRTFADTPRNRWDNERTQNLDTTQKKIMAQDYSNLAKEYDISTADRVNLAAKGALGQFLGGYQEDIGQYIKPENEYTPALTSRYVMEGDKEGLASARIEAQARQDAADKLYAMSSKNLQESAENIEAAKKGLSGAGKLLVDAGVAGSQMAADAAISAVTGAPFLGRLNMMTRAGGQGANEAREAGSSDYQQFLYGLSVAAVEGATEGMFGAFPNTYGKGFLDNAMSKAIGKFVKSPVGAAFIKDTAGEGIEEFVSSAVNPVLQSIYTEKAPNYSMDTLSEALYEGLVGSVLGAVGGGVNVLRNNRRATQNGTDTTTSPVNAQDLADRVQNTPVEAPVDITRMANNVVNQASPLDIRNLVARNGVSDMPTNAGSLGNPTPTNTNNIDTALPVLEQNQTDIGKNTPILQWSNTQANTPITQANTQANTQTNNQTNPLDLLRETARERAGIESGTSPVLLNDLVQRVDATESAKPVDVRGMAQRYANIQELANRAEAQREESANPIDIRSMAPQYVSLDDLKSRAKENTEQVTPVDARKMTVQPVSTGSLVDRIKAKQSNQESGGKTVDIRSLADVVKGSVDRVPTSPKVTEQVEPAAPTNENVEYTTARGVKEGLSKYYAIRVSDGGGNSYMDTEIVYNPVANTYQARIRRKYYSDNIVEDARNRIDYTGTEYKNRQDAVDEAVRCLSNWRFVEDDLEDTSPESYPAVQNAESKSTPHDSIATDVGGVLKSGGTLDSKSLFKFADKAYGGTQAEGVYTPKDAYDAMELAVNRYIVENAGDAVKTDSTAYAESYLQELEGLLNRLPTQTKRTEEQQSFQQFSTPPTIAYMAAWASGVNQNDVVLEPSAGIGGLAAFAKAVGAKTYVNELSKRRLALLESLGFDGVFNENAEQINNVLPDYVTPSVVIMNPPFSSTAGRTATNNTANAKRHIEQALERLEPNGRLVAILGKGMADDSKTFRSWWNDLRKEYSIACNLSIDNASFKKYGTSWGVQLVVIDKTGPQTGNTVVKSVDNINELPAILKPIKETRVYDNTGSEQQGAVKGSRKADGRNPSEVQSPPSGMGGESSGNVQSGSSRQGTGRDSGSHNKEQSGQPGFHTGKPVRGSSIAGELQEGNDNGDQGVSGRKGASESSTESRGETNTGKSETGMQRTGRDSSEPSAQRSADRPGHNRLKNKKVNTESVYSEYVPSKVPEMKGAKKHPAPLVESSAMASIEAPPITYTPSLPKSMIDRGYPSSAQLENIARAGQSHSQKLPDGSRAGYFIGDGTGVGKGVQIASIIKDNFNQGRTKAVWVSKNFDLLPDAIRDWKDVGGNEKDITPLNKIKNSKDISIDNGIIFTTYDTIRSTGRLEQLIQWLGEDFDGVIAYDESHSMANLTGGKGVFGGKGSGRAIKGNELQKKLPNARIIYVSATGATNVSNLAYADRLGLWGKGTAFKDVNDFVSKIESSGISAMELVAKDLKASGRYMARSISYDGVGYSTIQHNLTPMQKDIYDTMSRAWQTVNRNIEEALGITGASKNARTKAYITSNFYSTLQRFYNQILTSMAMPSVIKDMKKQLAAGNSCVLQIVNTNAAQAEREIAKIKESEGELDDLDLTPRDTLIGFIEKSFPVQAYEEYTDENGNIQSRPVNDSAGNPVIDRKALAMRDALIAKISQISVPEGPLEMLFSAFGTKEVSEITGRNRRVVPTKDGNGNTVMVEEKRSNASIVADAEAFQNGDKRILIFSEKGGTGKSYHADLRAKNQQKRIHYVIQAGWSADKAVQGFGRTHRSNQKQPPEFKLVTTDIMGQKRFISTIARRLDQLGALTKGQRNTGSGMFSETDNLENTIAFDSLREFYNRLGKNQIEGFDGREIFKKLGLEKKFYDQYGNFKMDEIEGRNMSKFLNRILALEMDEQNNLFSEFERIYQSNYEAAKQSGELDLGMENVKADKITIEDERVARKDERTGAETKYIKAKVYNKPTIVPLENVPTMRGLSSDFQGLVRYGDEVRAAFRIKDATDNYGNVKKQYLLQSPVKGGYKNHTVGEKTFKEECKKIPEKEWQDAWDSEIDKMPEYLESTAHMITGVILPIWDKLPQDRARVQRITADNGEQYLGRVIKNSEIDSILTRLGLGASKKETYKPDELWDRVLKNGDTVTLENDRMKIKRSRVSGENRVEITGDNIYWIAQNHRGIISENINYKFRYFIPTTEAGKEIFKAILKENPVLEVSTPRNSAVDNSVGSSENRWRAERNGSAKSEVQRVSDVIEKIRHDFDIPISTGGVTGSRNVQGQYRQNANTIRTRHTNDLPTICHELGHKLDSEYGITKGSGFTKALSKEIRENLDQNFAANYAENRLDREGVAEFLRYFMEDVSKAEEAYPSFFWYFSDKVGQGTMRMLGNLADDINAIYSQDKSSVLSSMRRASDRGPDYRTKREKVSDAVNKAYQAVVDPMHALKTLDRALGTNTHMYAVNASHVTATVEGLMDGDLYDFDGGRVSDGFYAALKDINMNQKSEEFNHFNEYLVVRHAPEVLAEGMDVFPDSDKNNIGFCLRRQAQLEAQYPQFEESAKRLYQFQRDLLRTWGVDTGLVSAEKYEEWGERWENYVPFNRHFSDREKREGAMRGNSARGGLANQNSTIRRMRGSTRDLQYPLDNIARNMAVLVTAGYRNKVMSIIRDEILDSDSYGNFGEQIPPEKVPHRFNLEDIKQNIMDEGFGRFDAETYNELNELMNEHLPDILTQFSKKTAHGNIVTVMINGKTEYWKIHDPQLLDSVANLAPYRVAGVARAVSRTTRVMSGNLTGLNVLWGIFSNGPRDFASYLVYANKLNPFQRLTSFFAGVPQYYMSCIAKSKASPLIRQYWAMGGGHGSSRYSADRNFTKDALRKFEGKKSYNPLDYLEFVADMIESGPRAAYFCALRKKGYSPQEAYYESNDITVNFWNTGKITKDVGIAVPFLGAGVKGVDKFVRYISADDVTGKNRKKVAATRVAGWMATSAIIAGICYALNMGDDDRKKDYFLLSNYVKNNRFNIPTGDGMYFSIPKPRELAVMASFFETLIERGQGNNHAFDEFYQYATSQLLPPLISDLASLNASGLANSTGVIGVLYSIWANKDYLGNPIVSKSMQYLPAEKQYKNTTSILAYWLGQGTGISPVVMDYAAKSILGGFATTFSSMFPVGGEDPKNAVAAAKSVPEKILKAAMPSGFMPNDKTFGIKGQYIKDNLYSNDVINRLYDKEEELKKDDTKSVEHKLVSNITSFWSEYNKRAKSLEANEKNRALRAEAVQTMVDFEKSFENNNFSNTMKKVMDIARRNDENEILPTAIKGTFQNDGEEVNLTADEFITYWKDYQGLYREKIGSIPFGDLNDTMSIKRAKKENDNAKKEAKNNILKMR